jgi:hypothetical protein
MLPQPERLNNRRVLADVIFEITCDRNSTTAQGEFYVTAKVEDKPVFDGVATCVLIIDNFDGKISVYWEEAGFENYKEHGLFGQMSVNFQRLQKLPARVLSIVGVDRNYTVFIGYGR